MRIDQIDIISRTAATLAESEGMRASAGGVVSHVAQALSAQIGFVALRHGDSAVADVVASHGLGAVDFRRLESRIIKSGLWRILHLSSPLVIDDLGQDTVLNFLGYG